MSNKSIDEMLSEYNLNKNSALYIVGFYLIHIVGYCYISTSFVQGILADFGINYSFWKVFWSLGIVRILLGMTEVAKNQEHSKTNIISYSFGKAVASWLLLGFAYWLYGYYY